jgi:hypothetical protein
VEVIDFPSPILIDIGNCKEVRELNNERKLNIWCDAPESMTIGGYIFD